MEELKKCPFCGGEAAIVPLEEQEYIAAGFYVSCANRECKAEAYTDDFPTEQEAIAAWNRRADGWISVKERLPEMFEIVLICDGETVLTGSYQGDGDWLNIMDDDMTVTHWMPLPKPPEDA
jgi:Lar family restriction alleviation protein